MRYKNIGTESDPWWQPVGLESFCIYPRLLPQEFFAAVPDPIQINGTSFALQWPAGQITERALELGPSFVEFVKVELVKVRMSFVDNYGELIESVEWAPKEILKRQNAAGLAHGV